MRQRVPCRNLSFELVCPRDQKSSFFGCRLVLPHFELKLLVDVFVHRVFAKEARVGTWFIVSVLRLSCPLSSDVYFLSLFSLSFLTYVSLLLMCGYTLVTFKANKRIKNEKNCLCVYALHFFFCFQQKPLLQSLPEPESEPEPESTSESESERAPASFRAFHCLARSKMARPT